MFIQTPVMAEITIVSCLTNIYEAGSGTYSRLLSSPMIFMVSINHESQRMYDQGQERNPQRSC